MSNAAMRLAEHMQGALSSLRGVFSENKDTVVCRESRCELCNGSLTTEGQKRAIQTVQECGHKYHEACLKQSLEQNRVEDSESDCKRGHCNKKCRTIVPFKHCVEDGQEKLFFNEDGSDHSMEQTAVKTENFKCCRSKEAKPNTGPGYLKTVGITTGALAVSWLAFSFLATAVVATAIGAAVYAEPDLFKKLTGEVTTNKQRDQATKILCRENTCKACNHPITKETELVAMKTIRRSGDQFHASCLNKILLDENNQVESDDGEFKKAQCPDQCRSYVEFKQIGEGADAQLVFKDQNGEAPVISDKVAGCEFKRGPRDGNDAFVRYATAATVALGVLWFASSIFHVAVGGLMIGTYLYAKPKVASAYQKAHEIAEPFIPKRQPRRFEVVSS